MARVYVVAVLLLAGHVVSQEDACAVESETCALHDEAGPWSTLLQQWALSNLTEHHGRHGRIMALPAAAQGYVVTDRALMPPPPPHHHHGPPGPGPHHGPHHGHHHGPPPGPRPYDEWQNSPPPTAGGKIVNRPTNPYKDQFKPSYPAPPPPPPNHGYPPPPGAGAADRIDERPPQKQVSETDLYLLGAIEKLVYRVDLMEKRLRKMEESVHYLVAGVDTKPEPCATNFTRLGSGCYHFSSVAANWKGASYACRNMKGHMLELGDEQEKRGLSSAVLADSRLKGGDFWTGGLNPGLLWIWSHSARPVGGNSTTDSATIVGEGRCLAWVHDPATNTMVYRGQDCALRHRYVCELKEDDTKLSNEINRAARKLRDKTKTVKTIDDAEQRL